MQSRLEILREKYDEDTTELDPEPFCHYDEGYRDLRYSYQFGIDYNGDERRNIGYLLIWSPRPQYSQQRESYENPFTGA